MHKLSGFLSLGIDVSAPFDGCNNVLDSPRGPSSAGHPYRPHISSMGVVENKSNGRGYVVVRCLPLPVPEWSPLFQKGGVMEVSNMFVTTLEGKEDREDEMALHSVWGDLVCGQGLERTWMEKRQVLELMWDSLSQYHCQIGKYIRNRISKDAIGK